MTYAFAVIPAPVPRSGRGQASRGQAPAGIQNQRKTGFPIKHALNLIEGWE
ncbi:MAG: hypothetical protein G01um101433_840 [Parcubacteria group bacterium Gr01-1014_33]|nr:MAG: hypothetical protein G01um101433_840 [Parcubacteria group bacterium Gr01-1014_33]